MDRKHRDDFIIFHSYAAWHPAIVSTSIPFLLLLLLLLLLLIVFNYNGEQTFSSQENTFAGFFVKDFTRYAGHT
jgi:hypothetical protein